MKRLFLLLIVTVMMKGIAFANAIPAHHALPADPAALVAVVDYVQNVTENGASTGAIRLAISGGTGTYTVTWTNSAHVGTWDLASTTISALPAGNYEITVSDGVEVKVLNQGVSESNAHAFAQKTMTEPPVIVIDPISVTTTTRSYLDDGTITFDVSGGTPAYTVTCISQADASVTTPSLVSGNTYRIAALAVGFYTIRVVDANACVIEAIDIQVEEPPYEILSFEANNGEPNPSEMEIVPGDNLPALPVVDLDDHVFVGWLIDNTDLIEEGDPYNYSESKTAYAHYVAANVSHIACFGEESGEITVDVVPNININYDIDLYLGSSFVTSITGTERVFSDLALGTYTVKVRDIVIDELEIIEAPEFTLAALSETVVQYGDYAVLEASGAQVYNWEAYPTGVVTPLHDNNVVLVWVEENTTVSVTGNYMGCISSASIELTIDACEGITEAQDAINGNHTYPVGEFASVCWFRENYAGTLYPDGTTAIPFARGYYHSQSPDSLANIDTYGRLYTWESATGTTSANRAFDDGKVQGVCPDGWRLPEASEMTRLGLYYTGDELRSQILWADGGGHSSPETGFYALPAGMYNASARRFEKMYTYTGFWTSSEVGAAGSSEAIYGWLTVYCDVLENGSNSTSSGQALSIRCVKVDEVGVYTIKAYENTDGTFTLYGVVNNGDYSIGDVGFDYTVAGTPETGVATYVGNTGAFSLVVPAGTTSFSAYSMKEGAEKLSGGQVAIP